MSNHPITRGSSRKHLAGVSAILISLLAGTISAQRAPQPTPPVLTTPSASTLQDLSAAYVCDAVNALQPGGNRQRRNAVSTELTSFCKSKGQTVIQKIVVCEMGTKSCRCDAEDSCTDVQKYCKTFSSKTVNSQNNAATSGVGSDCNIKALQTVTSVGKWILIL